MHMDKLNVYRKIYQLPEFSRNFMGVSALLYLQRPKVSRALIDLFILFWILKKNSQSAYILLSYYKVHLQYMYEDHYLHIIATFS